MPALAHELPPSNFPLRFQEALAFRGDFGGTEVVNPKGLAYDPALGRVIVSLSPYTFGYSQRVQILTAVSSDGSRVAFAPAYKMYRDVESLLAIVPPSGPPVNAGFSPGDLFIGRGPKDQISRISSTGVVLADVFVDLETDSGPWGGLTFDTQGTFGGRLVAVTTDGSVFLVDHNGNKTLHKNLGRRLEGVDVAPSGFGPLAGQIIVRVEGRSPHPNQDDEDPEGGKVYAIDAAGNLTWLADIGLTAEEIRFVPPNGGTYYQAELCFDRERENRLLMATASQFLSRLGRMVIVNELGGEIWEVGWDGSQYHQSLIGRRPGRWSSEGFRIQGTEFEAGCFAARPPAMPAWTAWAGVPGGGTTDVAPAAGVDQAGNLHLLAKGINDRRVYMNGMWGTTLTWGGWAEVPPGGFTTSHSLAVALHDEILYAFAIRDDGAIMFKRLFIQQSGLLTDPWAEVSGGGRTDAAVSAAVVNGRLVLAAKGIEDRQIYLNELSPAGRMWSGWYVVPGGGQTDRTPAVQAFQDELYVIIKGVSTDRILVKVRTADGDWTDWAPVPGGGATDTKITPLAVNRQLYLFAKGINDKAPYLSAASDTGSWGGWQAFPHGGTTDVHLAATAIGPRIFLFAKGINDKQIYMSHTP
jgi:hypothetical protein